MPGLSQKGSHKLHNTLEWSSIWEKLIFHKKPSPNLQYAPVTANSIYFREWYLIAIILPKKFKKHPRKVFNCILPQSSDIKGWTVFASWIFPPGSGSSLPPTICDHSLCFQAALPHHPPATAVAREDCFVLDFPPCPMNTARENTWSGLHTQGLTHTFM